MKITQIRTQPIEIPFDKPLGTSIHRITSVAALLVWIDTDEGITGESYLWVIGKHKLPVLMEMVRSLEPVVKHRNPLDVAARFDEMWNEINGTVFDSSESSMNNASAIWSKARAGELGVSISAIPSEQIKKRVIQNLFEAAASISYVTGLNMEERQLEMEVGMDPTPRKTNFNASVYVKVF